MTDGQSEVSRETEEIVDGFAEGVEPKGSPRLPMDWDFVVANAIGLKTVVLHNEQVLITPREWDKIHGIEHETCEGDVACVPFRPSVDLSEAFAAVEKVGLLFTSAAKPNLLLEKIPGGYIRVSFWSRPDKAIVGGEGTTLCLAICDAVVRFKEERSDG